MNKFVSILLMLASLAIKESVSAKAKERDAALEESMYEYDLLTSTKRLKFVREVVEDHHVKDFPRIRDCGPDETQNWYEPDPEDCSCYFVCTGKFYVHRKCSHGLLFDPHAEQCNWPEVVECNGRPLPWSIPEYQGPAASHYQSLFYE